MSPPSRRDLLYLLLAGVGPSPLPVVGAAQADDLTALSATEAAARIARRDVSPIELAEAYLARIDAANSELNAFITVTRDRARADARRTDLRGPLGGIPIAHKDLFETAGIRTTAGSRLFDQYIPRRDAALVARLADAGTVLLGKTNTHELGGGVTTINPFYGTTHNPANPARVPGGSSGGSAAAVAGRLAAAATGSDTGGSVRIPAAFCGCVGFKPTFGRLSTAGLLGACPTFDHVGFLTRTVADAALMFEAATGTSASGPTVTSGPPLRVGVARAFFFERLQEDVAKAMEAAIDRFRSRGARLLDLDLPIDGTTMPRVFDPIVAAEIWARYGPEWRARPSAFSPGFAEFFKNAAPSGAEVRAARLALAAFQESVRRVFDDVDVVLTPTVPVTAPPIEGPIDGALILRNTWPFNAARTPAVSLPCGADRAGLPIGLQLAGRPGADRLVLEAAQLFSDYRVLLQ